LENLISEVHGTAPLRIDVSGGWTDTPPSCYYYGGAVVNVAVNLNGSAPIRCTVRRLSEPLIRLRSKDLDSSDDVTTWDQLSDFAHLGSPFTISKAALALAGWLPRFAAVRYDSLVHQLGGCGFEVITESCVPAGSGLGTSSILAATVLGTISEAFCLGWSREDVALRTLVLEQMLTAGGGWQDQWGGIIAGAKLLTTSAGPIQQPEVKPLEQALWTHLDTAPCHLLYFTGITRTARQILGEIVKEMFLRVPIQRAQLDTMRRRAMEMAQCINKALQQPMDISLQRYGELLSLNWDDNQRLDSGCNPPAVESIIRQVRPLCWGLKLPGAGGGGFIYMVAKNKRAAGEIRRILTSNPPAPSARFFEMSLSDEGLTFSCDRT
jgi:galactokinase/mevalonate kinase-like predicted kinase